MKLRRSLYARPVIVRGEQCTTGAFARANEGEEGSGGVVADITKLSVGREEYYTRELATDHEQYLSGHGESPGRWYGAGADSLGLGAKHSVAGFQAMFEGRDPTTGELLGRPHGRPQRGAGVRRGPAPDQERLDPLRPRRPSHRRCGASSASRRAGRGGRLPGRAPGRPPRTRWCPACVRTGAAGGRI